MITYNASDIVKRAEQLADLENSDFISFSEKIALLNEAYQVLYQKGINKDVNAFVKYINTRDRVIQLPRDFYQLKAITMGHDKDIKVVLRRPANQSFNVLSYDIINNTLQINGETMGQNICVEYFPTPSTLTFPNKNKTLDLSNVIDMHKDIYIVDKSTAGIEIKSLNDSDFTKAITTSGIGNYLIHMEDDYITLTNSATTYLYNIDTGTFTTVTKPVVIYKNRTYLYDTVAKKMIVPEINLVFEDLDIDLSNCTIAIISEDKTKYVGQNYNGGLFINGVHQDFNANKMYSWGDIVYLSNGSSYIAAYDFSRNTTENSQEQMAVISIADIDDNTGYGYLGKRLGKYSLVSFYDDTVMNFPNNTYFVFLSYLLALAFKSKQGSDTSQLAILVENAENAFYDTLARDDWNTTRITNAY